MLDKHYLDDRTLAGLLRCPTRQAKGPDASGTRPRGNIRTGLRGGP